MYLRIIFHDCFGFNPDAYVEGPYLFFLIRYEKIILHLDIFL